MTWILSDGTEVELGGEVRGASVFAQELREAFAHGEAQVEVYAPPGGDVTLDLKDPTLLDMYLRQEGSGQWRPKKVTIVRSPQFERRVFEQPEDDTPPGAVN